MKQSRLFRTGTTLLLPALMLQVVLFAADPPNRAKVQFEGEEFTAEYETLLGRFDGHYVSFYRNGTKRSKGYFECNLRSGTWTISG